MAARQIIVPGAMPSRDANGRALPAKFRFYQPGATLSTPKPVYTDVTLTVAHPFPILSDSAGRWPQMWADDAQSFDVGWSDQVFDETIHVYTGITPANDAVLASVDLANASAGAASASATASATSAANAAASALVAAAAATGVVLTTTSATPNLIGTGLKTFVALQPNNLAVGMDIYAAETGNVANRMVGTITAKVGLSITMSVPAAGASGAGTPTAWTLGITAIGGVMSLAGLTGIVSAVAAKVALAIASTDITDFNAAADGRAAALAIALGRRR